MREMSVLQCARSVDGVLHGLVDPSPPLSVKKFIKYNFPELMKRSQQGMPRGKKRSYNCMLPVNYRLIICEHKKAGPWCSKAGVSRGARASHDKGKCRNHYKDAYQSNCHKVG